MTDYPSLIPSPPDWAVDCPALNLTFPALNRLQGCEQDPIFHAEGDVWVHTEMVCRALAVLPGFRALPDAGRRVLFLAALLHDLGKPERTRFEDGRLVSPGHADHGSHLAREILWRLNVPIEEREEIVSLIRLHHLPLHCADAGDSLRRVITASQTARCNLLALLAEADARGRECTDQQELLSAVSFFADYCREIGCFEEPYRFPSDHSRFLYFRKPHRDAGYLAYDDTVCEVILMSGLPGAGKDHWISRHATHLPMVSLDQIRREMGIAPTEPQTSVVKRAHSLARDLLRRQQSFVWNATHITRDVRSQSIRLCAENRARVHIVYIETSEDRLMQQNEKRDFPVPKHVMKRLISRWQVPDRTEAHRVDWISSPVP